MQNKRIEYIDAMRGFTMILVVYSHIITIGYGISFPTWNNFFIHFRMPLFFFISGWVLYKANRTWDFFSTINFLRKKFIIQIIPTVFFLLIYIYLFDKVGFAALGVFKEGYWFTYTLFEYFLLYGIFAFTWFSIFKKESLILDFIIIFFALSIYLLSTLTIGSDDSTFKKIIDVIGLYQWRYFFFFITGIIIKKHYEHFVKTMDNKYFSAFVILSLAGMLIFSDLLVKLPGGGTIDFILYGLLGIFVVLTYFRKNKELFERDKLFGRCLQYIGRRTLDIYLLHYFFLPDKFTVLGDFFSHYNIKILEFFVSSILALMVIIICLIVSNIIRLSPILAHYLFGVKMDFDRK